MKLNLTKVVFTATALLSSSIAPALVQADTFDHKSLRAFFSPLPDSAPSSSNPVNADKVALGKKLYLDKRFSAAGDLSCNSCHNLATFGVDNEPTSPGHKGQRGGRNSPSVYNAALHTAQFWDGRAADVEAQALGPVLNPGEMAVASEADVVKTMNSDPAYVSAFKKAFPEEKEPVTFKNFGRAIGAFERTLLTPSRFDEYLKGKDNALTSAELAGLTTFRDVGCVACHNGATLGGQMYQKLGLVKPYTGKDMGRFDLTKNEADKYFFKVPSLRNIEKTAPYLHDGSIKTLPEMVKFMGEYQLGRQLSQEQIDSIVTFLKALTGNPAQ
jgi:cytochrome c peroxidase